MIPTGTLTSLRFGQGTLPTGTLTSLRFGQGTLPAWPHSF